MHFFKNIFSAFFSESFLFTTLFRRAMQIPKSEPRNMTDLISYATERRTEDVYKAYQ